VGCSCTCDAKDDVDSRLDTDRLWGIRYVENFNLVLNMSHKRKSDGVDSSEGRDW